MRRGRSRRVRATPWRPFAMPTWKAFFCASEVGSWLAVFGKLGQVAHILVSGLILFWLELFLDFLDEMLWLIDLQFLGIQATKQVQLLRQAWLMRSLSGSSFLWGSVVWMEEGRDSWRPTWEFGSDHPSNDVQSETKAQLPKECPWSYCKGMIWSDCPTPISFKTFYPVWLIMAGSHLTSSPGMIKETPRPTAICLSWNWVPWSAGKAWAAA